MVIVASHLNKMGWGVKGDGGEEEGAEATTGWLGGFRRGGRR